jgi:predicted amidohydrolase YtcJ
MKIALLNGRIYTLHAKNTIFQALAIEDSIIVKTGTTEEIQDMDIAFDELIDLNGKTVLPGFMDAHTHLGQIALESLWVNLQDTTTIDQIYELLKTRIDETPPGNWVVGVNYDDSSWQDDETIAKLELDSLSTDHPIFLRRICGHYAVVNSRALELIEPSWKYVDRSTGVLVEDAVLGFMKIVKPDQAQREQGTYHMLERVHSLGITSVREIVNNYSVKVYDELDEKEELTLRIYGYIYVDDLEEYLKEYPDGKYNGQNFQVVGLKILLDGSMGARTAALKEPYYDDSANSGKLLYSDSELLTIFSRAKEFDLSLMVHTLGDGALEQFIRIYRELYSDQILGNPRGHSVEHVEVIDDELLKDLKETGLIVSSQPNFAGRWSLPGGMNEQRFGPKRLKRCNAYRTIVEAGIPVVFGSDCMPIDPLFGIRSAVYHPLQEQRLTPDQAIRAYTQNWYKLMKKIEFGIINESKIADLVILNLDPFLADEQKFEELKVVGTIFDGKIMFDEGLK